ncbi:MAG: glutaminyl-peptide cyclotransferase [Bryocella sp.]
MILRFRTLLLLLAISAVARAAVPVYGYKVVAQYPHSTDSYTEGFFYLNGLFYEGTGLQGHSSVMAIYPFTGMPVKQHVLAPQYFGEGIVNFGKYLYQWTWQTHTGFVYDLKTFAPVREFHYTGEGWGMTQNGHEIITSDGSSTLSFRSPQTFAVTRRITVHDGAQKIDLVNELEWVKGEIFANVWHTNRIARISPADGRVLGWIDLTGLLPAGQQRDAEAVLNGIAYDAQHDRLFVTGKEWPAIYEIKLVPKAASKK